MSHPDPSIPTHDDDVPALADSHAPVAPKPEKPLPGATDLPGRSRAGSRAGGSTGGFDTMLGKLVVSTGLVTEDEIEQCRAHLDQDDNESTLSDLLLDNQYITPRQLDRLRKEFEAKKGSQRIPGYRIRKKLGAGAMATVFLAEQISLDRLVAVKVLPRKFTEDKSFIERFYKEGRAAARLNHPNIVQAYDVGQAGDHHYFVMEYVEGATVYERIQEVKRIGEPETVDILIQSARALHHAHEQGFIHRDIKPKNLMLTSEGQVKVADLGLARNLEDVEAAKAEAGRAYGTPYYISPEQIRGELDIGPQADIYGLGATAYHMVAGHVPFSGKNPSEVMHRHLKAPLVPPDQANPALSASFCQVIEMMMAKDRRDRYQNTADLIEDLKLIAAGEPPHFARPKIDLAKLAIQVESGAEPAQIRQAPPGTGTMSPALITSIVLNVLLLIILTVVAMG